MRMYAQYSNSTPFRGFLPKVQPMSSRVELLKFAQPVAQTFVGLGALSSDVTTIIANTIESQEGYKPGTIAWEQNNPGNLMFAGQSGAVLGRNGFAKFDSYEAGRAALERQIGLYADRGLTIASMMAVYAPFGHGNNDPVAYANRIAGALGVSPDTPLSSLQASGAFPGSAWASFSLDSLSSLPTGAIVAGVASLVFIVVAFQD